LELDLQLVGATGNWVGAEWVGGNWLTKTEVEVDGLEKEKRTIKTD